MTTKTFVLTVILALSAALAATASPAWALGGPDTCPAGFVMQTPADPDAQRLADRNGDGRVCAKSTTPRLQSFAARRGPNALRPNPRDCASCMVVLTDTYAAVGNPDECEAPFARDDALGYGALDRNGDGVLCSATVGQALVLLDNAKAAS